MGEKVAVIYKSKYGATKRYAGWIALKLDADLYELSDISKNDLKKYDRIIYGGPLYRGKIKGIKFITNNYDNIKDKKISLFMVGIKNFEESYINTTLLNNIDQEIINNIDVFYFRGKLNYKELSIKDRIVIYGLREKITDKYQQDVSADEKIILEIINKPIDYIDKKSIDVLLNKEPIGN